MAESAEPPFTLRAEGDMLRVEVGSDSGLEPPRQKSGTSDGAPNCEELQRRLQDKEQELQELQRRLQSSGLKTKVPLSPTKRPGSGLMPPGNVQAHNKPLAIIIPMIGLGESFAEAGFRMPKPLVNVVGRPVVLWLLDHLRVNPQDLVYLAVPSLLERQHGIGRLLSREFPTLNFQVVEFPFETRGWVETIFSVVQQMAGRELRLPLVTLDCSTIYHGVDILAKVRELPSGAGASLYFDSSASLLKHGAVASQFSYIKVDTEGSISKVAEKHVISSMANTGGYIFSSARDFKMAAERLLETPQEGVSSGLYASSLISAMIADRRRFLGIRVDVREFEIVSTPSLLQNFIRKVSLGELKMERKMRFCFELDGTLVSEPRLMDDLSSCEPIRDAIALVRQLHRAGHTIIIVTSRGMAKGRGLDTAIAEVGRQTFATLSQLDIPYHELHFGKPSADVFIDSRTLNAQADIQRDLGWSVDTEPGADKELEGAVEARSFNVVRAKGAEHVIKSSAPDVLRGECYWYRCIPPALSHFFPVPVEIVDGEDGSDGPTNSSITMSKVSGVVFSHLVTQRLLMKTSLRRLLHALHAVHTQEPLKESPAAAEPRATVKELCSNYAQKVSRRVTKHGDLYKSLGKELGINVDRLAKVVVSFLEDFEANERTRHAYYIHGDPVFSNVLRTADDNVVFIDMRGELDKRLTTQGDAHYDLSKVYQSLCGYDFMMLDYVLDETTSEILDALRATFWDEVRQLYPDISPRDVRLHTASHFFSLVPLHEVRSRMLRYLRTSFSMLSVEGLL